MTRTTRSATIAATILLTTSLAACGGRGDDGAEAGGCDPGWSDSTLKLGSSIPLSGPAAAYAGLANGAKAYFDHLNESGGVKFGDGKTRKIEMTVLDDAYDPARTVSNARTLVQKDNVFAIMDVLGTSPNVAIADYLKNEGVPNLFAQTGSEEVQKLHDDGTQITGYIPSYDFEANVLAQYLTENKPQAKVALLYQNDGFGKNILEAYEREFADTDIEIVATESYEVTGTSVDSQVVNLSQSGADTFLDYGVGTKMTQSLKKKAELGWEPLTLVSSGSTNAAGLMQPAGPGAADGAVSFNWLKDVTSATWKDDEGVKKYQEVANASDGLIRADDFAGGNGYTSAQILVAALEKMDGCTRDDLYDAVQNLREVRTDLVLPGLSVTTDKETSFVFQQVQIMTFDGTSWNFDDSKNYSFL